MWAYLTSGADDEQIAELEATLDGRDALPRGGRNVGALLAGMTGG